MKASSFFQEVQLPIFCFCLFSFDLSYKALFVTFHLKWLVPMDQDFYQVYHSKRKTCHFSGPSVIKAVLFLLETLEGNLDGGRHCKIIAFACNYTFSANLQDDGVPMFALCL